MSFFGGVTSWPDGKDPEPTKKVLLPDLVRLLVPSRVRRKLAFLDQHADKNYYVIVHHCTGVKALDVIVQAAQENRAECAGRPQHFLCPTRILGRGSWNRPGAKWISGRGVKIHVEFGPSINRIRNSVS